VNKDSKIYIAGHNGLVGSAIVRELKRRGYNNLVLKIHKELDLERQEEVESFFESEKPEYVFLAAAKVGGIMSNKTYPAEFIYNNLIIQTNVINSAYKNNVKKLLFLGSSCIYPKHAPQPMKEEHLLTSPLEPTNEAYAVAKIAGLKMCKYYNEQYGTNYISVQPTNLYGPNDNYDLFNSHVLPALIKKFYDSKIEKKSYVELWGSGSSKREFLYVDDLAEAVVFLMENFDYREIGELINIGTGDDVTIKELAEIIKAVVGYEGNIKWDRSKPDGTPQKLLDVSKINKLGWKAKTKLLNGIQETFKDYLNNI